MLAGALSYPFVLLGKKPVTVLLCLLFGVGVDAAVYYGFSLAGLFSPGSLSSGTSRALRDIAYFALCSATTTPANVLILVEALIALSMREPGRKTDLGDCLRFFWVSLLAYGLVTAPALVLNEWSRVALTPRMGPTAAALTAGILVSFVPQALFLFRFAFAWPHTLVVSSPVFFRSWALTRGRFWTIAGVLTPVLLMQTLIYYGGAIAASHIVYAFPTLTPVYTDTNQPGLGWAIYIVLFQLSRVLGSFYLAAGNVYLYARLTPRPAMLAHVFT